MITICNPAIAELAVDEIEIVGGAADWKVVATGLTIMAGGAALSAVPPAAGAVMSIGLHTVILGLAVD